MDCGLLPIVPGSWPRWVAVAVEAALVVVSVRGELHTQTHGITVSRRTHIRPRSGVMC